MEQSLGKQTKEVLLSSLSRKRQQARDVDVV